jgi:hypothetical protein
MLHKDMYVVICLDKDNSNFIEIYVDRQNNTHLPLFANCLLFKRGSLCNAECRVLPIIYECQQYLLEFITKEVIKIIISTCLQNLITDIKKKVQNKN